MTLLKAAAPCPCNNGTVGAGQSPLGGLVELSQPSKTGYLGILVASDPVILGGATGARLMGRLMGLASSCLGSVVGLVWCPQACPCSFHCRAPNEMGPSRSDRPIFQNTGDERKQGYKAPN